MRAKEQHNQIEALNAENAGLNTKAARRDDLETTVNLLLQRLSALEQAAQTPVAVTE